jgi:hypothetical protein
MKIVCKQCDSRKSPLRSENYVMASRWKILPKIVSPSGPKNSASVIWLHGSGMISVCNKKARVIKLLKGQ